MQDYCPTKFFRFQCYIFQPFRLLRVQYNRYRRRKNRRNIFCRCGPTEMRKGDIRNGRLLFQVYKNEARENGLEDSKETALLNVKLATIVCCCSLETHHFSVHIKYELCRSIFFNSMVTSFHFSLALLIEIVTAPIRTTASRRG